jgi:hypothetical protein
MKYMRRFTFVEYAAMPARLRMLTKLVVIVLVTAGFMGLPVKLLGQERDQNAALLKPYLEPETISRLEWTLMKFNLSWQGAFVGSADYITSLPVWFDYRNMRFVANFRVSEKRDLRDPEPFFNLPKPRREAIMQKGIAYLEDLLGQWFPEIKKDSNLVYAQFQYWNRGGGSSVVAKYEAGRLSLSE